MSNPQGDSRLFELSRMVDQFASDRDWGKFHTTKNLRMALAVEFRVASPIKSFEVPAYSCMSPLHG